MPTELEDKMVDMNTIGPVLRRARTDANLTQTEVADALDISLWTYNRLENSKRTFEMRWLAKLPVRMRAPIVKLLTEQTNQHLSFLRRFSPNPEFQVPRFTRGSPPRFTRGAPIQQVA